MKIPNKGEFQEIAINHLPDTDFKDFMNIYKKRIEKPKSMKISKLILL